MNLQIGQPAAPTFAEPLALLSDCHRRVERFLEALRTVGRLAPKRPLNPVEREALETSLRYFREAAPRHTADEEESLFPRLRQVDPAEVATALAQLDRLERDHQTAAPHHALLETLGQRWLAAGCLSPDEADSFLHAAEELIVLYTKHIALEDGEIFPLAARLLSASALVEIGQEMARRRGLFPGSIPARRKDHSHASTLPFQTL
jgi:hemerythrin-like domain-containing protein